MFSCKMETVRFGVQSSYCYFSVCRFDTQAKVRTRNFLTALDEKLNSLPIVVLVPLPVFPILGLSVKKKKRCCITPRCVLCKPVPCTSGFQLVLASEFRQLQEKARRCHCKGRPVVNILNFLCINLHLSYLSL